MAKIFATCEPALAAANCRRALAVDDALDDPRVRRHRDEEDVANRGDSCSHAEHSRLLLLSLATPPGTCCGLPAALPAAESMRDRACDIRRASRAGALRAATAVVIGTRVVPQETRAT
jgi:hypothetical protein